MAGVSAKGRGRVRVEHALLNGYPAAIVRAGNDPVVTISLDIVDGRIRRVFLVRNPDKLRGLASRES
jgi:RNA polymerase sigma-70 factor (ECF subfamily)